MPLHEIFFVNLKMLHTLLVHHPLPLIIVISKVIFALAFVGSFIFHKPLPPKKGPIQKSILIKSKRAVFLPESICDFLKDSLVKISVRQKFGFNL